jgi:molybdopterin converting factor small subunit
MRVSVLLFGPEAAAAGSARVEVEAPAGSTCADLREMLAARCPALRPHLPAARFAVNAEFAEPQAIITPADEVALIGLVSGG